jgi:hypothetical protein
MLSLFGKLVRGSRMAGKIGPLSKKSVDRRFFVFDTTFVNKAPTTPMKSP